MLVADKEGEEGVDYELTEGSAWITVGTISLYIKKTDEGVEVEMYPLYDEGDEPWSRLSFPLTR